MIYFLNRQHTGGGTDIEDGSVACKATVIPLYHTPILENDPASHSCYEKICFSHVLFQHC